MSEQYLMALDAGSGAGRCVLVSLDGAKVVSAYQEWGYTTPAGLGMMAVDFNPQQFWKIFIDVIQTAMKKAGIKSEQVAAISSTSQREGMVFLDEGGREVYAGPNRDYRAVIEGMQLLNTCGEELYRRTGHFPAGMVGAARLMWFKNRNPKVYEQIHHVLSINDWILYRLSNEYACEPTNAAETCLYDLVNCDWTYDIIDQLELPRSIFPKILTAGNVLGVLSKQAASETGLLPGTPVVIGGADTQCGLLGCGCIHPNDISAISGTTTPVQLVSASPVVDPSQRLWGGAHAVPGQFILESNAGASGSIYQWYRDSFYPDAIEASKITGKSAYAAMNEEAQLAPAGCAGMQSYVGVMIMNAKSMGIPTNVILLGMSPLAAPNQSSRPLLTRAILESLAFAVRANTEQILQVASPKPAFMGVCGGLANSRLYLEALANTLALPVRVPRIKEGTAVGAAICAGIGARTFHDFEEGVQALVQIESVVEPDEKLTKQYNNFYRRWMKTLEQLLALSSKP